MSPSSRRQFLQTVAVASAATTLGCAPRSGGLDAGVDPWFRISLAQWSLHRALRAGELTHLDFISQTRSTYDLDAVEYVNAFLMERARDEAYLTQMRTRCDDAGVQSLLIMCDSEGRLGDPDAAARRQAVENHHKWAHAAAFLGCHSIRVNAASEGTWEEQSRLAADGLRRLARFAAALEINVLVENHGGLSSNGRWLAETIERADHPRLGTLPDFGNFNIDADTSYDIYEGVAELMPHARAVSAKSHAFDEAGNETTKDYRRLLQIVHDASYRGWVGIEYEGESMPERDGVLATKALLESVRAEIAAN